MNGSQLIKEYNKICNKHAGISLLPDLNDNELFIWIAAKTYNFGRSINDSLETAKCHMEDRKKAEKLFGYKKCDLLGIN